MSNARAVEQLKRIAKAVGPSARKELTLRILLAASEEVRTQVQLGFRQSVDPDGKPWAPLVSRKGQILRLTGRLASSFTARPVPPGRVEAGTNVSYAVFHQQGTKGRSKAFSRDQAVDKRGAFTKETGKGKRKATGKRRLNFRAGGGAIPARRMLPGATLSPQWERALRNAINKSFLRFWKELSA